MWWWYSLISVYNIVQNCERVVCLVHQVRVQSWPWKMCSILIHLKFVVQVHIRMHRAILRPSLCALRLHSSQVLSTRLVRLASTSDGRQPAAFTPLPPPKPTANDAPRRIKINPKDACDYSSFHFSMVLNLSQWIPQDCIHPQNMLNYSSNRPRFKNSSKHSRQKIQDIMNSSPLSSPSPTATVMLLHWMIWEIF